MQTKRPYVLTIAGFDPSSGAGITADVKTFEQLKVYGLAVCSGLTRQTEDQFFAVEWRSFEAVKKEIEALLKKYPVQAVKFGIVPSMDFLSKTVKLVHKLRPEAKIVVDPVWRTSTGFDLNGQTTLSKSLLSHVTLLTPNLPEFDRLRERSTPAQFIKSITQYSNLLLKGGHARSKKGTDILYQNDREIKFMPSEIKTYAKHGSGCVLSAAITAQLAKGKGLEEACRLGKRYIDKFLKSNNSLLGFHAA